MDCPYCNSPDHQNIYSLVRHVMMCHVPGQQDLYKSLFYRAPDFEDPDDPGDVVWAKCQCGGTISSLQTTFNQSLARHLRSCGKMPELLELLDEHAPADPPAVSDPGS
jgi:hypothetical protein